MTPPSHVLNTAWTFGKDCAPIFYTPPLIKAVDCCMHNKDLDYMKCIFIWVMHHSILHELNQISHPGIQDDRSVFVG